MRNFRAFLPCISLSDSAMLDGLIPHLGWSILSKLAAEQHGKTFGFGYIASSLLPFALLPEHWQRKIIKPITYSNDNVRLANE